MELIQVQYIQRVNLQNNMLKPLLPLGSVVKVAGIVKSVMIFGRIVNGQNNNGENCYYEYMGCLWPDGFTNYEKLVFFDNTSISEIVFYGLTNSLEDEHRHKLEFLRYQISNGGVTTDIIV
jgi:hypothetical protein